MSNEIDYKDTLNLPLTDFPMKANLAQREPGILAKWEEMGIYQQMLACRDPQKSFQMCDGPPYANGDIHIGHALNKILKDIVVKSKAMSGYYAPFIPGWDCHGLPIELQVEKKIGKAGAKVDARTFRQHCREYAQTQIDLQRASFKRLGILADWDSPYTTMDYKFEADIIRALGKIIANGYLVRGDRPVHWCVHCGSALAEAEVEYENKTSDAIDVKFAVVDPMAVLRLFNSPTEKSPIATTTRDITTPISVVIWTTTPWTLPANQAVAINAKLNYALVQYQQQYLIVAVDLLSAVMARLGGDADYKILGTCLGQQLEHVQLQHPFYARQVPIILGDHVTTDAGTGCVHTAPAHGTDDYIIGKRYNLPIDNPVDANGCFFAQIPLVGGQYVFKANAVILQLLQERGNLLCAEKLTHSYPHCWRHKEPLIFRATPQWFISMEAHDLRGTALAAIKQVKWIPQWGEARINGMVAGRPDWCISRQRTWGTPLALVIHKETSQLHPRSAEIIEKVARLVEVQGVQAWFDVSLEELLPASEIAQYQKVTDMLDVWFDSGVVHACVADQRPELHSPVDLYLEGSDQHRGWFQSSLLTSVAMKQQAPYRQVLTHGFTVDSEGHKMSKSLGNVVAPAKIIQTLGADVLRLWVAATDYRAELRISEQILTRISDSYRRIRNTARFLLANLHGFDPATDIVPVGEMLVLDRWIVDQTRQLQTEIIAAYDAYEFLTIYQKVHNFCANELGSFYLDIIKDRQYTCKTDGIPRRSAQTALFYIIEALVRWIAPILSFTAEEIWQYIPGQRAASVFLTTWYTDMPALPASIQMNDTFWRQVIQVRDEVNKVLETARSNGVLGAALEAVVTLYCQPELLQLLSHLNTELRFILITSDAKLQPWSTASEIAIATAVPELSVLVQKAPGMKCQRCWHRTDDVGNDTKHPGICLRCVANLTVGEKRQYA